MLTLKTKSSLETEELGKIMGSLLQPGDVIAVNGSLGAGKTCLARGIASGMGIVNRVSSPTFALIHEYDEGPVPLYHMDMYRLASADELEDLGYEDYFYGSGVTFLEWAKQVEPYLPRQRLDITISHVADQEQMRELQLVPKGGRYEQLIKELRQHVCAGH